MAAGRRHETPRSCPRGEMPYYGRNDVNNDDAFHVS